MNALILAAGYGTRLAAIAKDTPKPLLPVGPKPLIDYSVDKLKTVPTLQEIVVVTNNKFEKNFQAWAQTHKGSPIRVINDGTNTPEDRLGSVGDMHYVWSREKQMNDWLVIGGDNIFDTDLSKFVSFAQSKAPAVTIGLYDIHDLAAATKFGICAMDGAYRIKSFLEKPKEPPSTLAAMCLYYFPKETLGYIEEYKKVSNALDAAGSYIQWLVEKKNVYGFQFSGKWYDIGSVESLKEAQEHFSAGG